MSQPDDKFSQLQANLERFKGEKDLTSLKSVKLNLKDFNITNEDEHITISFSEEDLKSIKGGEVYIAVSGRRC